MSSYNSGVLIRALRGRKRWSQSKVLNHDILSEVNFSRIENQHQSPYRETFRKVMASLQMPIETFFCPYLENQSIELIQMREAARYYLSLITEYPFAIEKLKPLLEQMGLTGLFTDGINKQFLLSCQAKLSVTLKCDSSEIFRLIDEGLNITFPEFDEESFKSEMLLFEEVALLHTKALAYCRDGDTVKAISLLERILEGFKNIPQDDGDKERMVAPVLLTLSQCYIQSGFYRKAFIACRAGYSLSLKRNRGIHAPDFAFNMARCLHHSNHNRVTTPLIKQAYFGYTLLRKYDAASRVRKYAQETLGLHFDTYGVESLNHIIPEPIFSSGKPVGCRSIGDLIAAFRTDADLTLGRLSEGICSPSNLAKIEDGSIQGNVYHLESIMQRLGRHIDKYFNTFLSSKDFADKQMRDEINFRLACGKYREAEELISELSEKKAYKSGVNKQFIDLAKADLCFHKEGFSQEHLSLLRKVLNFDSMDLDFDKIARTRLTYYEFIAINQMASNLCSTENSAHGLHLFEVLKASMDCYIVDEAEKMRMYTSVLYNYSKFLGLANRHEEALYIAEQDDNLCIKHMRLSLLPSLLLNRACGLLYVNRKEESLPYFAQAFYGLRLMGRLDDAKATKNFVFDEFSIMFD